LEIDEDEQEIVSSPKEFKVCWERGILSVDEDKNTG
jgi:hypothetical protein